MGRGTGRAVMRGWVAAVASAVMASGLLLAGEARSQGPPFDPGLYEEIKREWERAERERTSEERRRARRASRDAHRGLSREQAKDVARTSFRGTFDAPMGIDLRAEAAGEPEFVNDHIAKLERGGRTALVEGLLPLRDEDRTGQAEPVSLALEDRATTFASENPLVEVDFRKDAGAGISLPEVGVSVTPLPVASAPPERIGDRLFWANVAPDTDLAVMPAATGFETLHILRSEASPEELRLALSLPEGATLRLDGAAGARGVAVMRGEEKLATVRSPTAVDADGAPVPATLTLEGSEVVLRVPHRAGDHMYPIAVDPLVDAFEWYYWGNRDHTGWAYSGSPGIVGEWFTDGWSLWGYGPYIYNPNATWVPAGSFGNFYFNAYGNATIYRGFATHVHHSRPACCAYDSSAIALGIWSPARAGWEGPIFFSGQSFDGWEPNVCARDNCATNSDPGNSYTFRFHKDYGGQGVAYVGMAYVYQADNISPYLYTPGGSSGPVKHHKRDGSGTWANHDPAAGGWLPGGVALGSEPHAKDDGFGVKSVHLLRDGTSLSDFARPCRGNNYQGDNARGAPCDHEMHHRLEYSTGNVAGMPSLPEGVNTLRARGNDLAGNASSQSSEWTVKVDRSGPAVGLSGRLYELRDDWLYDAAADVSVAASDGTDSEPRSGVAAVEVFVTPPGASERSVKREGGLCQAERNCSQALLYAFRPDDFSEGDGAYRFRVEARDKLGNASSTSWTVHVDRRGDVYTAEVYDGTVGTRGALTAVESHRLGTTSARREEPDWIKTRTTTTCVDGRACDQVRMRSRDSEAQPGARDSFSQYEGDPGDARLSPVADMADRSDVNDANRRGRGPSTSVKASWQTLPPAGSAEYELYEYQAPEPHVQAGVDDPDGPDHSSSTPGDSTLTVRLYVDSTTKLPLHEEVTDSATGETARYFYSYRRDRRELRELPADFFRVRSPDEDGAARSGTAEAPAYSNLLRLTSARPVGTVIDLETNASYQPLDLGTAPVVATTSYCLASGLMYEARDDEVASIPEGADPEETPYELSVITQAEAHYNALSPGSACTAAGSGSLDAPALQVVSVAAGSQMAGEYRRLHIAPANAIALDSSLAQSGWGASPVVIGGGTTSTAYVIPAGAGKSSLMIERPGVVVVVTGAFTKTDAQQIVGQLEAQ